MKRYELTLRCASFNIWPENHEFGIRLHRLPRWLHREGDNSNLSYAVRSYKADRRINEDCTKTIDNAVGPALWMNEATGGRQLGKDWVLAVGEYVHAGVTVRRPIAGEIDVVICYETATSVNESELLLTLTPLVYGFASFLRLSHDPYLSVAAPPQLVLYGDDGGSKVAQQVRMSVVARREIGEKELQVSANSFANIVNDQGIDLAMRVGAAARRSFTMQREVDEVDRFCDAWEICEMLTRDVQAPGTVVSRIATAVGGHICMKKARVENVLGLARIYRVRKDLVHNGVDNPSGLLESLPLLEAIALELVRWKLRMPYTGNRAIDDEVLKKGRK